MLRCHPRLLSPGPASGVEAAATAHQFERCSRSVLHKANAAGAFPSLRDGQMLMFRRRSRFYSYSTNSSPLKPHLLVIRPTITARAKWRLPLALGVPGPWNLSIFDLHATRSAINISVAAMSTVANPHQAHSQHQPSSDSTYSPSTSSSSRASSRQGRTFKNPENAKKLQVGRMSAFFPLGYKEAASQWVCSRRRCLHMRPNCAMLTSPPKK